MENDLKGNENYFEFRFELPGVDRNFLCSL